MIIGDARKRRDEEMSTLNGIPIRYRTIPEPGLLLYDMMYGASLEELSQERDRTQAILEGLLYPGVSSDRHGGATPPTAGQDGQ